MNFDKERVNDYAKNMEMEIVRRIMPANMWLKTLNDVDKRVAYRALVKLLGEGSVSFKDRIVSLRMIEFDWLFSKTMGGTFMGELMRDE